MKGKAEKNEPCRYKFQNDFNENPFNQQRVAHKNRMACPENQWSDNIEA
jgi:hypothetical protein